MVMVMVIVIVIVPYLEISKISIIDHQLPTWMSLYLDPSRDTGRGMSTSGLVTTHSFRF